MKDASREKKKRDFPAGQTRMAGMCSSFIIMYLLPNFHLPIDQLLQQRNSIL